MEEVDLYLSELKRKKGSRRGGSGEDVGRGRLRRPWVGGANDHGRCEGSNGHAGDHKGPHPTSSPPPPLRIIRPSFLNLTPIGYFMRVPWGESPGSLRKLSISRKVHDLRSRSKWKRSSPCMTISSSICSDLSKRRRGTSLHLLRCSSRRTLRAFIESGRAHRREHCGHRAPPREGAKPFSTGCNSLAQ